MKSLQWQFLFSLHWYIFGSRIWLILKFGLQCIIWKFRCGSIYDKLFTRKVVIFWWWNIVFCGHQTFSSCCKTEQRPTVWFVFSLRSPLLLSIIHVCRIHYSCFTPHHQFSGSGYRNGCTGFTLVIQLLFIIQNI